MRVYDEVESCCTPSGCGSRSPWWWPSQLGLPRNLFISVCLEKLDIKHVNIVMFNRYILSSWSASWGCPSRRLWWGPGCKYKKKHTLAPSITITVSIFQFGISILSIVCSQNKILERSGRKVSVRPPSPLINKCLW